MTDASTSTRFYFDGLDAAAQALLTVILHARDTEDEYRFGGLSAEAILTSGLILEGQIEEVASKVEKIAGSSRYDD